MVEHNIHETPQYGPPVADVVISALGALVIGFIIWGGGWITFYGWNYLAGVLQLNPPNDPTLNSAIQAAFTGIPILAGLVATWVSYRFLLKLD